jgi:hypothetical protein
MVAPIGADSFPLALQELEAIADLMDIFSSGELHDADEVGDGSTSSKCGDGSVDEKCCTSSDGNASTVSAATKSPTSSDTPTPCVEAAAQVESLTSSLSDEGELQLSGSVASAEAAARKVSQVAASGEARRQLLQRRRQLYRRKQLQISVLQSSLKEERMRRDEAEVSVEKLSRENTKLKKDMDENMQMVKNWQHKCRVLFEKCNVAIKNVHGHQASVADKLLRRKKSCLNMKKKLHEATEKVEKYETDNQLLCAICTTERRTVAFLPCSHLICCSSCVRNLAKLDKHDCPICRQKVNGHVSVIIAQGSGDWRR